MGGFWSEQVLGSLDVGTIRNTTTVSIIFQLVLMHVDALNLSSNLHEFMPAGVIVCSSINNIYRIIQVRYGKLVSLHCMKHVTSPFCILTPFCGDPHKRRLILYRCRGEHGVQRGTSETKLEGAVWTAPRPEKSPVWGGTVSWGLLNIAHGFVFGMKWLPQMINTRGWWNSISWPYKRFWLD